MHELPVRGSVFSTGHSPRPLCRQIDSAFSVLFQKLISFIVSNFPLFNLFFAIFGLEKANRATLDLKAT